LGAGVIIKSGLTVRGLTTAASLWLTASIGMSIGAGYLELGIVTTLIGLFALIILNKFENLYTKEVYRILEIYTDSNTKDENLLSVIERKGVKIIYFDKEIDYKNNEVKIIFTLKIRHKETIDKLSNKIITDLDNTSIDIHKLKWTHR
jgi:putative Mg2+ transporter-C (MgtC) family protein